MGKSFHVLALCCIIPFLMIELLSFSAILWLPIFRHKMLFTVVSQVPLISIWFSSKLLYFSLVGRFRLTFQSAASSSSSSPHHTLIYIVVARKGGPDIDIVTCSVDLHKHGFKVSCSILCWCTFPSLGFPLPDALIVVDFVVWFLISSSVAMLKTVLRSSHVYICKHVLTIWKNCPWRYHFDSGWVVPISVHVLPEPCTYPIEKYSNFWNMILSIVSNVYLRTSQLIQQNESHHNNLNYHLSITIIHKRCTRKIK